MSLRKSSTCNAFAESCRPWRSIHPFDQMIPHDIHRLFRSATVQLLRLSRWTGKVSCEGLDAAPGSKMNLPACLWVQILSGVWHLEYFTCSPGEGPRKAKRDSTRFLLRIISQYEDLRVQQGSPSEGPDLELHGMKG